MSLRNVSVVEELGKQIEIASIHKPAQDEDVPADGAVWYRVEGLDVDEMGEDRATNHELNDLDGGDELGNPAGSSDVESADGEVEVHDGVNEEVKSWN
jgi:hypothetical protein